MYPYLQKIEALLKCSHMGKFLQNFRIYAENFKKHKIYDQNSTDLLIRFNESEEQFEETEDFFETSTIIQKALTFGIDTNINSEGDEKYVTNLYKMLLDNNKIGQSSLSTQLTPAENRLLEATTNLDLTKINRFKNYLTSKSHGDMLRMKRVHILQKALDVQEKRDIFRYNKTWRIRRQRARRLRTEITKVQLQCYERYKKLNEKDYKEFSDNNGCDKWKFGVLKKAGKQKEKKDIEDQLRGWTELKSKFKEELNDLADNIKDGIYKEGNNDEEEKDDDEKKSRRLQETDEDGDPQVGSTDTDLNNRVLQEMSQGGVGVNKNLGKFVQDDQSDDGGKDESHEERTESFGLTPDGITKTHYVVTDMNQHHEDHNVQNGMVAGHVKKGLSVAAVQNDQKKAVKTNLVQNDQKKAAKTNLLQNDLLEGANNNKNTALHVETNSSDRITPDGLTHEIFMTTDITQHNQNSKIENLQVQAKSADKISRMASSMIAQDDLIAENLQTRRLKVETTVQQGENRHVEKSVQQSEAHSGKNSAVHVETNQSVSVSPDGLTQTKLSTTDLSQSNQHHQTQNSAVSNIIATKIGGSLSVSAEEGNQRRLGKTSAISNKNMAHVE